ncbi:MAG TPA: hypothetical protein VFO94_20305 [Gammaproteobacteria bacterium]|nr:hypothetical protein [Gammaproteobacteria bacterium]
MAVQAESLEVLEKADASPALARAIVRAIEIEMAARTGGLATKHDVVQLGTDVHTELAELRGELRAETAELRSEVRTLGTELRAEMKTFATKGELGAAVGSLARQMYLAVLGQTAVMLGFTYFLVMLLR